MSAPPPPPGEPVASYQLRRLLDRRTVRAALALGALPRGVATARELWRHPAEVEDPGPPTTRVRWPEPHLRVAHLAATPPTDATAPGVPLRPDVWRTQLEVQRPDLVLVDAAPSWLDAATLAALRAAADAPVVTIRPVAEQLGADAFDLVVDPADPDGPGAPAVDHRVDRPVGHPRDPRGTAAWRAGEPLPGDPGLATVAVHERGADDGTAAAGALRLAARGVVVVAAAGGRVERAFGDHLVVAEADALATTAAELADDADRVERTSVRQRRHVLGRHTIDDRARQLLAAAGVRVRATPTISVLLATRRAEQAPAALAQVLAQTHRELDVQLLLHGIELDPARLPDDPRVTVHRVAAELPLGAVLDVGLDAARGELFAKMDDDDLYGAGHLADLRVALRYSGADVVGRWSNVVHLEEQDVTVHQRVDRQERWAHHLPGATMLVHGDVLRRLRWRHVRHGVDRELVRAVHADGGTAYGTHRFGFLRRRHGDHTFARHDRGFAAEGAGTPGCDRTVLDV
ncbi:glycosyltransferase family 2 protein [Nitriliruptoraceae bacterium ZYF776]|nr:glycosyltransferase family 2 protein [Profundirhabdus halotolerans]